MEPQRSAVRRRSGISFRGVLRTERGSVILIGFENLPIAPKAAPKTATTPDHGRPSKREDEGAGVGHEYLNARYYDGSRGQFLSEDPVFLGTPKQQILSDPQSLDAYSYSDDNPITKSDPSGKYGENVLQYPQIFAPAAAFDWAAIGAAASPYAVVGAGALAIGGAAYLAATGPFENVTTIPVGPYPGLQNVVGTPNTPYLLANPIPLNGDMPPTPPNSNGPKWKIVGYGALMTGAAACELTNCVDRFYQQFTSNVSGNSNGNNGGIGYWVQPPSTNQTTVKFASNSGGGGPSSAQAWLLPNQNAASKYSFSGGKNAYGETYSQLFPH